MTFLLRFFIFLTLILCSSSSVTHAKDIHYNHNSITIPELQKQEDFTIFTPTNIPAYWILDTKTNSCISLHYMDKNDTKIMVGICQRRIYPLWEEDMSPVAKQVKINGNKGYFQDWENNSVVDKRGEILTGGILNWTQDRTFIEMISTRLSKEQMLEIASSMR